MSASRYFILCTVFFGVLSCSSNSYRTSLIPNTKYQALNNIYGAYTIITQSQGPDLEGELIGVKNDTLHLLGETDFSHIPIDSVRSAMLILTENRAQKYLIWTLVATAIPLFGAAVHTDYGSEFAILAIPAFVFGMIAYLVENARDPHIVSYPDQIESIYDLNRYCRFPGGVPDDVYLPSLQQASFVK